MKRNNRKDRYLKRDQRFIYAIIGSNSFYIGHSKQPSFANVYTKKLMNPKEATYDYFHSDEHKPGCFILHSDVMSIPEAYRYMIAWCRIIQESYKIPCIDVALTEYASNMFEETIEIYEKEKDTLGQMIKCENCRTKNYHKARCNCALDLQGEYYHEKNSNDISG